MRRPRGVHEGRLLRGVRKRGRPGHSWESGLISIREERAKRRTLSRGSVIRFNLNKISLASK